MPSQTPTEKLAYVAQIEPSNNDTVSSATWAISPSGPTVGSATNSGATSTVLVSGITLGVAYVLSCHITGASAQLYDGIIEIDGRAATLMGVSTLQQRTFLCG
jgi:hypothetical protein